MSRLLLAAPMMLASVSCAGQYIHSSVYDDELRVRRTDDTEAITRVMEEYAQSLDGMDLDAIRALISDDYYENSGTTDSTRDDYGADGLDALFTTLRDHVDDLDVGIAVRDVVVEGDSADVLFEYTMRVRYTVADQSHWTTERDVNRFQLQRERGQWLIVSGL